jgi:hypothetical protein
MRRALFVALLGAVAVARGAGAQDDKTIQSLQQEIFTEVEALVDVAAGTDQLRRMAAMREALLRLGAAAPNSGSTRAVVLGPAATNPDARLPVEPGPLDDDPQFVANLEALLEAATDPTPAEGGTRPRIIGGWPVVGFSGTIALTRKDRLDPDQPLCTGVLLDRQHVLTAAHCTCLNLDKVVHAGSKIGGDPLGRRFYVDPKHRFARVVCAGFADLNGDRQVQVIRGRDHALVRLKTSVPSDIRTVAVAAEAIARSARRVVAVGFGKDAHERTGTKRYVDLAVASADCTGSVGQQSRAERYGCIEGREMVAMDAVFTGAEAPPAARRLKKDTCPGDSGGPLLLDHAGTYLLVATTSRAVKGWGDCGDGGIYSLVDEEVVAWLKEHNVSVKVVTE